jgi:eukaryotic-like serine/threonine-protein kinase
MAVTDTLINTLFDGRYRILRKLGAGGMANVYLAEDEELGRRVAIKILNDRYANDELFIERFRREAKSAAGLSHPNIVSIYDRGQAEGTYYIAMEVIEGRSLKELILTRGPLPIGQAIAYTLEMLEALRFAHRHGIIHRDIKPHNILIGERLKVTDFGIARAGASQMTEAGSIMGTAQYLSPEQARGAPVTASSDLYSIGIVLYEMLTGKVPFTGDSAIEIAMKHLNEAPRPPSKIRPEIPEELDQVVLRALAKAPEDRYQTAEEFAEDLHRVEAGLPLAPETAEAATALLTAPTAAAAIGGTTEVLPDEATRVAAPRPTTPAQPPAYRPPYMYDEPPPKRRRWVPWLLVALLLAAAGFAGWYVYTQIQEQLEASQPVAVPNVVGLREELAVDKIEEAGFVRAPTSSRASSWSSVPTQGRGSRRGTKSRSSSRPASRRRRSPTSWEWTTPMRSMHSKTPTSTRRNARSSRTSAWAAWSDRSRPQGRSCRRVPRSSCGSRRASRPWRCPTS